jgi:hypothetical protein
LVPNEGNGKDHDQTPAVAPTRFSGIATGGETP